MRGAALALLLTACATARPPVTERVKVSNLELSFSGPGEGQLKVDVPVNALAPNRVEWRVLLDGHPFATGVDENPPFANGVLGLRPLLSWRHLAWREGVRRLVVSVRGEATWLTRPEVLHFEGEREVLVTGAPRFDPRGEP